MERIPERIDSTFRYVLIAARRAEQLVQGARPKLDTAAGKPTSTAMLEVSQDLVEWAYGPPPAPEPEPVAEESAGDETAP
ncbi:MAG: DNA-directed RNA polymerase subunit omega [Thermoanaerobaculia bacterium]|nr:MAG: DNA-directed RNA polymerase subunit omega [Thermoanaerobaculia bacterium]